jgi:hypothetical protein
MNFTHIHYGLAFLTMAACVIGLRWIVRRCMGRSTTSTPFPDIHEVSARDARAFSHH